MVASTFLAIAPYLTVNQALRSGQPRDADTKFMIKCRGTHKVKLKCKQTHETKTEKKYDSDITIELRRRDVLGLDCLVGSGLAMLTEETHVVGAQDGSCELAFSPFGLGYCDRDERQRVSQPAHCIHHGGHAPSRLPAQATTTNEEAKGELGFKEVGFP
jgi:hypothetical protein